MVRRRFRRRLRHWSLVGALSGAVLSPTLGAGCVTFGQQVRPAEDVRAQVEAIAAARPQLQAVVKAALPGIQGVVANVTLDVATKAPSKLTVAVRSFFEVPQQMLVTDGTVVTIYDATSGSPRFAQGPATGRSLQRLLGLPLTPDDAVALLLGRPPVEPPRPDYPPPRLTIGALQDDDDAPGTDVDVERVGRGRLRFRVDAHQGVTRLEVYAGEGHLLATAAYADPSAEHAGLHRKITVRLAEPAPEGPAEVVLQLSEIQLGGEPLDDEAFVLTPPPGTRVDAL